MDFTHINDEGRAKMVDVSKKEITDRTAVAKGQVIVSRETMELIKSGGIKKGDVLSVAQVAGIMACKKTADLIPMCHSINITSSDISFELSDTVITITATVKCTSVTGVEMEALTAVSVCALTIYDMCKSVQRDIKITDIMLKYKNGGKSGEFTNEC